MSPLITAYIPAEADCIFKKPLAEEVRTFVPKVSVSGYYFLVTDNFIPNSQSLSENVLTYSLEPSLPSFSEHFNLLAFSNIMFQGSQPMSGNELRILKNTASRLISKTPTSLRKK